MNKRVHLSWLGFVAVAALIAAPAIAQDLATVDVGPNGVAFNSLGHASGFVLTVSAPDGTVDRYTFPAGSAPRFDLGGGEADGTYVWELRPIASPRSRAQGDALALPNKVSQSGAFTVAGGTIAVGGVEGAKSGDSGGPLAKDQVILDDLIVNGGSICVGLDCVNGESFGFDTLRLKENNLRIRFFDTSNSASFPTRDWQITANDSSNGGQDKFSIDDIDGGRTPFTIEANAPSHSLYVEDGGRIGFGTATPVVDLHVVSGNTPTLRLEQNGSSGFTPQTWDVAGNEANFFVRDATNGSTLPFRIRPGASSAAFDISGNDDVGFGTNSPSASIHVLRSDASAQVRVEDSGGGDVSLLNLRNNGVARITLNNTTASNYRFTSANNGDLVINSPTSGTNPLTLTQAGNLTVLGTVTPMSDRNAKENFEAVDPQGVLDRLAQVPIDSWNYKADDDEVRHLGPVAQDFYTAFGLGGSDKGISVTDSAGVAFAAIQALHKQVTEKEAENAELAERVAKLEAMVEALAAANN